jgi:AcrR family transcriptional regulator
MEPRVSLREKHAAETRQRLLDAALDLFQRRGFEATTVEDIAERADGSGRPFFRYFPSKEATLFHDIEDRLALLRQWTDERPPDERPGDVLVNVLSRMIVDVETTIERPTLAFMVRLFDERPALRTYQRTTIAERTERQMAAALAERAGCSPDDPGIKALIGAVAACFDIALRQWIETGDDFERTFRVVLSACASLFPVDPVEPTDHGG